MKWVHYHTLQQEPLFALINIYHEMLLTSFGLKLFFLFQSLKEEFDQQEALLQELENHAVLYRQQGKMEASARLELQTQLLKVL